MSNSFQMILESGKKGLIQDNIQSKYRPVSEKRPRENDYFSQQNDALPMISNKIQFPVMNVSDWNNRSSQQQQPITSNRQGNQPKENNLNPSNNTINMMGMRGLNVENNLKGYSRQQPDQQGKSSLNLLTNNSSQTQQLNQQFNASSKAFIQQHLNSSFTQNSNETVPLHQNVHPANQLISPNTFQLNLNGEQELLRRERIKEQNLQEKMLVVQKEQKVSSEVAYSFKQMSRLLDACLKLDETGAGITSIKQNDFYLPNGSHFIQYKSIEFPQSIKSFYNQYGEERGGEHISVNKGIISELSLAWVSIDSKLFMWKYGPQSFASFTRLSNKNEYYKQNKDQYGTKRDEKIEREEVKEFDMEETVLSIAFGQPKHAIFKQNEIKNVIVIAFPTCIKVKHIKLENHDLGIEDINVSISTDHELVNKIVFSKKGRIFFGGSTGRVKYIDYFKSQILGITISERFRAKEGVKWQQKIKQQIPLLKQSEQIIDISVDDTRHILYALVEIKDKFIFRNPFSSHENESKCTHRIDVYDLGAFDDEFTLIGSLSQEQFCEQLLSNQTNHFHLLPKCQELSIISVSAIEKFQSNDINFVIVTQAGIRAYYSVKTKPITDKKNQILSAQDTKEARERFQMFEKYRPIAEFYLMNVKGIIEVTSQPQPFRNMHIFYDHKDYQTSRGSYIQVDEESQKLVLNAFAARSGMALQRIENNQSKLIFIESNSCYIARQKENMFQNHQIFSEYHNNFYVATERIGEMVLDFYSRDDNFNILSDLTFAQIPDKNLLSPQISGLIQLNSFEQLEASQMIGEQNGQQAYICLNDLAKQSYAPPSHYVVLTSKGILLYYQQRPIDILFQLIKVLPEYITEPNLSTSQLQYLHLQQKKMNRYGNQVLEVKNNASEKQSACEFFEQYIVTYGVTETFAMLSEMLCHSHLEYYINLNVHNHLDKQLKGRLSDTTLNNTNNFLQGTQYQMFEKIIPGNKPEKPIEPADIPETIITEISEDILKKAHFLFQKYGNILLDETSENQFAAKQINDDFHNTLGKAWEWTRRKYTSKVEGILLYFSRLIRPIWNKALVNQYAFKFFINEPIENFKREEISAFTRRLNEFKFWLENETKVIYCNELKENSVSTSDQSVNNIYMKNTQIPNNNRFGNGNRYKSNDEKMQEIKADEAKLIDDLLRFCTKILQVANLFLFISENKLRFNLNNIEFKDLRDDILQIRFKDIFVDKKNEKIIKNYVLQAIKLDPKYMDQARLVLRQFNTIFQERDFNISQAEIKLQKVLNEFSKSGVPEAKYLNECTNILLDHIESLNSEYIEKYFQYYTALDSRVDYVKVVIECIKFHTRIIENIERQQKETEALEEQLRSSQTYNPVNKYSEQLKIQKQILEDNSQQREFCIQKIIQVLEDIQKESEFEEKEKPAKDQQITSIISIIKNYPLDLVHTLVIDFLLRHKRKNDILDLNSPFTEQIFSNFGNESADCLKIKFKFLKQMGNVREAYNVAYQISNYKNKTHLPDRILLEDRISFTEIAIYDVNLILNDFNISGDAKLNYVNERDILIKQLKLLRIQKGVYEKLTNAISAVENKLKKEKDLQKYNDDCKKFKDGIHVLQYIRMDEAMLDSYFIWPLGLVEFDLLLFDISQENKTDSSIEQIYIKLIQRQSNEDLYQLNSWPHNIQDTLMMLNETLHNKSKLFNLDHIVVNCEAKNVEMYSKTKFSIKKFNELYNSVLAQREDTESKILNSPVWLSYFLISKCQFSPISILSLYSDIRNILKDYTQSEHQNHLCNCIFMILRFSITHICAVLQNHESQSREIFTMRNSIPAIEKILETLGNDINYMIAQKPENSSELNTYKQSFMKVQEEMNSLIGQVEQLDRDYQRRNSLNSQNITRQSQQTDMSQNDDYEFTFNRSETGRQQPNLLNQFNRQQRTQPLSYNIVDLTQSTQKNDLSYTGRQQPNSQNQFNRQPFNVPQNQKDNANRINGNNSQNNESMNVFEQFNNEKQNITFANLNENQKQANRNALNRSTPDEEEMVLDKNLLPEKYRIMQNKEE